jgi:hypothetical protein
MRITLLFLLGLSFGLFTYGQTAIIFTGTDIPSYLGTGWAWGQSTLEVEQGAGIDGTNALKWVQGDEWGEGWTGIGFNVDPPFDLSPYWQDQSITIKLKCDEGVGPLRIQYEGGDPWGKIGKVFQPTADNQWHEYNFPLSELEYQEGSTSIDSSAIGVVGIMAEASGIVGKVVFITDWYITTEPSLIIFNGIAIPSNLEMWIWGTTTVEVETGAGPVPGTNAIKWTQGEGGMGFGFTVTPPYNLSEVWLTDSVKFNLKAEEGVDSITIMFYSINNTIARGTIFVPFTDNQWHEYSLPLNELDSLFGSGFDPSSITYVEVNTGVFAGQGVAGKVVYITDWWTGNPVFDVVPPAAPSGLSATTGTYINTITWTDVEGENGERYNLYYSKNPITDVTQADVVKLKINENLQQADHSLRAPATDQEVSYYYGITCSDASGNISEISLFGPITNTAQGVPTISINPPATFVADGDLSEWSGITPIHRAPSDGSQYVVSWGEPFDNDDDLRFDAYLAVDNTYFYFAFDAVDDVVAYQDPSTNQQDSPDFHIGLYNWHGPSHTAYRRGEEPDYLIRFAQSRVVIDLIADGDSLSVPGADYYWASKDLTPGYIIEARIPWALLAERAGDSVFVPVEGYRIPIDFLINDADALGYRESMLTYSPFNDGNSWADVSLWLYTWIGNLWEPVGVGNEDNVINSYSLSQNYPNPFNPTTQINYTLEKPGFVNLKVYDLLGRLIATLINEQQNSGVHTINFDASNLSSGVYFYQINSGSFSSTRKMMLIK